MFKWYVWVLCIVVLAACKLKSTHTSKKQVLPLPQLNYVYYPIKQQDCNRILLGENIQLKISFFNQFNELVRDTVWQIYFGDVHVPSFLFSSLLRATACDSVVISGLSSIDYPTVSYVILDKKVDWDNNEQRFFNELNYPNNKLLPVNQQFTSVDYGDTVVYQGFTSYHSGEWLKWKKDTLIYTAVDKAFWIKKWELLAYPDFLFYARNLVNNHVVTADSLVLNDYVFIESVSKKNKITPPVKHNEQWEKINDGVHIYFLQKGTGAYVKPKEWIKLAYTILDKDKNEIYQAPEPYFFYLEDPIVPESWNLALKNARVGDRIRIQSTPEYAYGKKGLYPFVPPHALLYFDFEVLETQTP